MTERQSKHENFVLNYVERNVPFGEPRANLRCGLSDASHLCDAIAADILAAGRTSKHRNELAAVAKRCGDAIWALRDKIGVATPTPDANKRERG